MNNLFIIILIICITISINVQDTFAEKLSDIIELENSVNNMISNDDFDNALMNLDKILEIEPNNINALNNKGGILINLGNYSEAVQYFDTVLELNENNTKSLNNKGIALYKQANYIDSLRIFYKSLKTDPFNEITINNTRNIVDSLAWIDETENTHAVLSIIDKNNNLVSYTKTSKVSIQPPLGYIFLEEFGKINEIEVDGKKIKTVEFTHSYSSDRTQYVALANFFLHIGDFETNVMELELNGQIVTDNDTLEYKIIIYDPLFLHE